MAASLTRDSKAIAVTSPVLRCCDDTCRVPNRIENTVIMMQKSRASPSCLTSREERASAPPDMIWILSATAWICSASRGSRVMHMATVMVAPTQGLRKRNVSTSARDANW